MRRSIEPTYNRCDTGDRFTVEVRLGEHRLSLKAIPDPFVHTTVVICWRDLLRCLFQSGATVTVVVGGDREIVEDVCELDDDYIGRRDSTRRHAWDTHIAGVLRKVPHNPQNVRDAL